MSYSVHSFWYNIVQLNYKRKTPCHFSLSWLNTHLRSTAVCLQHKFSLHFLCRVNVQCWYDVRIHVADSALFTWLTHPAIETQATPEVTAPNPAIENWRIIKSRFQPKMITLPSLNVAEAMLLCLTWSVAMRKQGEEQKQSRGSQPVGERGGTAGGQGSRMKRYHPIAHLSLRRPARLLYGLTWSRGRHREDGGEGGLLPTVCCQDYVTKSNTRDGWGIYIYTHKYTL